MRTHEETLEMIQALINDIDKHLKDIEQIVLNRFEYATKLTHFMDQEDQESMTEEEKEELLNEVLDINQESDKLYDLDNQQHSAHSWDAGVYYELGLVKSRLIMMLPENVEP